jgi:hypothetical protein
MNVGDVIGMNGKMRLILKSKEVRNIDNEKEIMTEKRTNIFMGKLTLSIFVSDIMEALKQENHTDETYSKWCVKNNVCVGIVSKLQTAPVYFNTKGEKLVYVFLDRDTKKFSPIIKKDGTKVMKNIEENHMKWG